MMLPFSVGMKIPEEDPVRQASAQLEELDYTQLYRAYSPNGRKSAVEPRILFEVLVYGYVNKLYSSRDIEEACRKRIDFMWLLDGEPAPDHSTISRFRSGRAREAIEGLFYQYVRRLEEQGETNHEAVFVDGTKLESAAGRYTFVWKKAVEKQLEKVKEAVRADFTRRGIPGYATKKKLRELVETQDTGGFVHGTGKRKSPEQREWEKSRELLERWEKYEGQLLTIGTRRNSCSKTDPDATFMRMKEDHMRNGQLKPAYNVQLAVNSEYITGIGAFSNRTDSGTLAPFLRHLERQHGCRYESMVADAGYESMENYLYLENSGQVSFIKPVNYEQSKKKAYGEQVGRAENMSYLADEDCYVCAAGRRLPFRRETTSIGAYGQFETTAFYRCEDCSGCSCRAVCGKAKDDKPKELKIKPDFQKKREASRANITSEKGVLLRVNRSIQVEGAFGVLKQDFGFRRFLTRGWAKISSELFLLAFAFDLRKFWTKWKNGRLLSHLFSPLRI